MQIEEPFGILALGAPCLLSQRTPRSQHSSMSPLAALGPCSRSSKQGQTEAARAHLSGIMHGNCIRNATATGGVSQC